MDDKHNCEPPSLNVLREGLDQLLTRNAPLCEVVEFVVPLHRQYPSTLAALILSYLKSHWFLEPEVIRNWPKEFLDTLSYVWKYIPYLPNPNNHPFGIREQLIAQGITDTTLPMARRRRFLRLLIFDGLQIPGFVANADWTMPEVFYDCMPARKWIVMNKIPAWEDLQFSNIDFLRGSILSPDRFTFARTENIAAMEAILEDDPAGFMIPYDLAGRNLPACIVTEVFAHGATRILLELYQRNYLCNLCTPRQLLFFCCAHCKGEGAATLVEELEHEHPGLVQTSVDALGHNAFWYSLYLCDSGYHAIAETLQPNSPLRQKLLELGCDPNQQTYLGLSYADILPLPDGKTA